MSALVRRTNTQTGKVGWTGPIRSDRQAEREAQAWRDAGWLAEVLPSTAETRREANAWQRGANRTR